MASSTWSRVGLGELFYARERIYARTRGAVDGSLRFSLSYI